MLRHIQPRGEITRVGKGGKAAHGETDIGQGVIAPTRGDGGRRDVADQARIKRFAIRDREKRLRARQGAGGLVAVAAKVARDDPAANGKAGVTKM